MASLAKELQLSNSTSSTLKLDLLMSSYIEYKRLQQRSMSIDLNESMLPLDKVSRIACAYREAAYKALSKVLELLTELEGKRTIKGNLIQNNFNVNVEDARLKDIKWHRCSPLEISLRRALKINSYGLNKI